MGVYKYYTIEEIKSKNKTTWDQELKKYIFVNNSYDPLSLPNNGPTIIGMSIQVFRVQ